MSHLRSISLATLVCVACVCSRPSLAAETPAATANRTSLSPGQIDVSMSRVFIMVGKTGLGHEHGVEGLIRSASLKSGATAGAGEIVFDTTTFQADTAATRQYVGLEGMTDADTRQQVNANMLGVDVLNVRRYPTATFKVNSISPMRADRPGIPPQYQLDGEFTLHGTTRKLKLVAEATPATG
jgi:polyisoprenoid-binding protein YceI